MIEEQSAGAVIFREMPDAKREFLLLKYAAGHTEFPKGHLENREDWEAAAKREILEETGLKIDTFLYDWTKTISYEFSRYGTKRRKVVKFYLAKVDNQAKVTLSKEHGSFFWAEYDAALKLLTYETAKGVLEEAENFLKSLEEPVNG